MFPAKGLWASGTPRNQVRVATCQENHAQKAARLLTPSTLRRTGVAVSGSSQAALLQSAHT